MLRNVTRALAGVTLLAGSLLVVPGGAQAATGYRGTAHGAIVHVDALTLNAMRIADAEVGTSGAQVDSNGMKKVLNVYRRAIVAGAPEGAHSGSTANIVGAGVLLSPPDAAHLIKPFTASHFSPGTDAAVDTSVLKQSLAPVAFADVIHNTADSEWNSSCVIGAPIALGRERVALADVVETADNAATPATSGFDHPLVGVDAGDGGLRRGASETVSFEQIYESAHGLGLWSASAATIAPVTLLKGTANEFSIEVGGLSYLVARSDGSPGGASVVFKVPLITVTQGTTTQTVLPGNPIVLRAPTTGDALAQIKVGVAEALPGSGLGTALTSAAGTIAAAQGNVVEVTLLDAVAQGLRGATVAIGHLEATSTVPAGGISCSLPVTKAANPPAVNVGHDFTTTITVSNPFDCTLSGVTLTDVITTEQGALFEIASTEPSVSAPGGSGLDHATLAWALGSIKAGESKTVTVKLTAQGSGGKIVDTASGTGTLTNCPLKPGGSSADVTGFGNGSVAVSGSSTLSVPSSEVLGEKIHRPATNTKGKKLAFTGLDDCGMYAGGLLLLALALFLAKFTKRGEVF
jgi:hypothetical protein